MTPGFSSSRAGCRHRAIVVAATLIAVFGAGDVRAQTPAPSCEEQLQRTNLGTQALQADVEKKGVEINGLRAEVDGLRLKVTSCALPGHDEDLKRQLDEQRRAFDKERQALQVDLKRQLDERGRGFDSERKAFQDELERLRNRPTNTAELNGLRDELTRTREDLTRSREEVATARDKQRREGFENAIAEAQRCNLLVRSPGEEVAYSGMVSDQTVLDELERRLQASGARVDLSRVRALNQPLCLTAIGAGWVLARALVNGMPNPEALTDDTALIQGVGNWLPHNDGECNDALASLQADQRMGGRVAVMGGTISIFSARGGAQAGVCSGRVEANQQRLHYDPAPPSGQAGILMLKVR